MGNLSMDEVRANNPTVIARRSSSAEPPVEYRLREIVRGRIHDIIETTFTVVWDDGALVFTFNCQEPDMENLFVTPQVWDGDSVAILLETPGHSYYQIEINPDGVVFDSDRGSRIRERWQSQAQVESRKTPDSWHLTVRIPVVTPAEGDADPNHNVAGPPPSVENPWHVNIGRVRIRTGESGRNVHGGKSAFAFVPTGGSYHVPEKFAKLIVED